MNQVGTFKNGTAKWNNGMPIALGELRFPPATNTAAPSMQLNRRITSFSEAFSRTYQAVARAGRCCSAPTAFFFALISRLGLFFQSLQ
jgi:hypothetical protein